VTVATDLARRTEPAERKTVRELIERYAPEIEKALPAQLGAERFTRIVLTELGRNPALYECSQESLVAACLLSAQLGLEPGPLGHVYLVPFKEKGVARVQFIIGYKGLVSLAYRSGEIKDIVARTVYEEEPWSYEETQAGPRFRHSPMPPSVRGAAKLWYGRARTRSGGSVVLVSYPEEIEARKNRSPAARKGSGPWVTDYDAMARKTVIRMMWPSLPTSAVLARGFAVDEAVVPPEAIDAESVEEVLPDWPEDEAGA
jgi:recombination protein RecT